MDMLEELLSLCRAYGNSELLSLLSGLSVNTVDTWLNGVCPTVRNAEKVANMLGYEIVLKKKEE